MCYRKLAEEGEHLFTVNKLVNNIGKDFVHLFAPHETLKWELWE